MPADRPLRIAGVAGSLRRASFNRGLLRAAVESAPEGMTIEPLEIRDLPHYDADLDVDGGPDVVREFKEHIIAADGLLIATPEYNYSMSGVLKNALDWASRAPERAMQNKPVAIVGATPGRWGTVRSQMALRQMLRLPGLPRAALAAVPDRRCPRALRRRRQPHRRGDAPRARRCARGLRDLDPAGRIAAGRDRDS